MAQSLGYLDTASDDRSYKYSWRIAIYDLVQTWSIELIRVLK